MNNSDMTVVLDMWAIFRETAPPNKREDAALRMLKVLEEYGVEIDKHSLEGEDSYLDTALDNLLHGNEEEYDEYDEDEEDY